MDNNIEISLLLDFYGGLLTEKQQDVADLYYNGDYSLSEIADDLNISRQGVRDSLKRAELQLRLYEEKIGLVSLRKELDEIKNIAENAINDGNADIMKAALDKIYKTLKG